MHDVSDHPFRTRFAGTIVAEAMFPKKQTGKVAIIATGLPSSPFKKEVLRFLASQGYVVLAPRYRGTWESEGSFLEKSPALDLRDIIAELGQTHSVKDLSTGAMKPVRVSAIHLFGSSFGGPAVLLNSRSPLVKKIIALSPVLDWKAEGESEPFPSFISFTRSAFGDAYRTLKKTDWQKLIETDFYNPIDHTLSIVGKKIFIIQAADDTVVPAAPLIPFVQKTGTAYYMKPVGGHLSLSHLRQRFYWNKVKDFLNS